MKSQNRALPWIISIIAIITIGSIGAMIYLFADFSTPTPEPIEEQTTAIPGSEPPYNFDYSWTEHPYIAHALGGIMGNVYTNSYEAFLLNYQLGQRVFEVDFSITDDGATVAAHDAAGWLANATIPANSDFENPEPNAPSFTYDNFASSLWFGKYHSVTLDTLFRLMQQYPDIYIVTDTKYYDQERVQQQFTAFLSTANTIDPSLLDRFIIQIYEPEMLAKIMAIYPWRSVIYTLYQDPDWTPENVVEFAHTSGVKFITLWGSWITPEITTLWESSDLKIATHTINDLNYAKQLRSLGVDVIYTDFLLPDPESSD